MNAPKITDTEVRYIIAGLIEQHPTQAQELALLMGIDSSSFRYLINKFRQKIETYAHLQKHLPSIARYEVAWRCPIQERIKQFFELLCVRQGCTPIDLYDLMCGMSERFCDLDDHYYTIEDIEEDLKEMKGGLSVPLEEHWFVEELSTYAKMAGIIAHDLPPRSELAIWLKAWHKQTFQVIIKRDPVQTMLLFIEVSLGVAGLPYLQPDDELPLLQLMRGER